jgi:hypothetical protein
MKMKPGNADSAGLHLLPLDGWFAEAGRALVDGFEIFV